MRLTDEKLALLGDHEAAKRLTDAGVLMPCPFCGKPLTDEAVEMVVERINEMDGMKNGLG